VCHERRRKRRRCRADDGSEASRSRLAGAGFKPPGAAAFEKAIGKNRQVCGEKMSASEPLRTHRNGFQTLSKRAGVGTARRSLRVACVLLRRQPVYRRHELTVGVSTERGNLGWGVKGNSQVPISMRENTDTHPRGGATRSSEEAPVMGVERRGCVIRSGLLCQPARSGGA
jgi:hypothetical protein